MKLLEDTRNHIVDVLSTGEHDIVFMKKDKTLREMRCTRDMEFIPEERRPKEAKKDKKENLTSVPVFDLEKQEWRSFTLTSLHSIDGDDYKEKINEVLDRNENDML